MAERDQGENVGFAAASAVPPASSEQVRARMQAQARTDTAPELELRRELHRRGLRYRVNLAPVPGKRVRADVVFTRARVAVFVDGCFWHGCPVHGRTPATNSRWWREKIARNVRRDLRHAQLLADSGWEVIRVWEHEAAGEVADRVATVVRSRSD